MNTLARNPRFRELLQRIGQSVHERDEHTKRKDRRNATKAGKQLDVLYGEIGLLLYHHLEPLKQRFIAGDAKAIDEVLDFLATSPLYNALRNKGRPAAETVIPSATGLPAAGRESFFDCS